MGLIDLRSNLSWNAQFPLGNRVNVEASGYGPVTRGNTRFQLNDNLSVSVGTGGFGNTGFFQPSRLLTNELRVTAGGETSPISVFTRQNQIGVGGSIFNGLLGYDFQHSGGKRTGFFRINPSGGDTYGDQFNPLITVGLGDSYLNSQDVSTLGQTPYASSPIQQQYNKFNIQSEAHDPFGLGIRSTVQLSGIQRRGSIETSTFAGGDNSTSIVPELSDFPIGGFNTHQGYQRQSDQRRLAFESSPRGQANTTKTTSLRQLGFKSSDNGQQDKINRSNFIAGKPIDGYEVGQNNLKQDEIYSGVSAVNNNLVKLSGENSVGSDFTSFNSPNTSGNQGPLMQGPLGDPASPSLGGLQSGVGSSNTPPASGLQSDTSLDAQFAPGSANEQMRYSYSPDTPGDPYGGANDPSGQKAFGGQMITVSKEKDGVGKDDIQPESWQRTQEEREEFPKSSGESDAGYKYETLDYPDLSSAASSRKSKTTENYDFLKKSNYTPDEEGKLSNKSYKDGELVRDPKYPNAQGQGDFDGGGLSQGTSEEGYKYKAMGYNDIPTPSKSDKPKHGGMYSAYGGSSKPTFKGSIGSSYTPGKGASGAGLTERKTWEPKVDGNPGDIEFKFKSVQGGSEIKFRAFIGGMSEAFAPGWNGQQDQGRADARYMYESFERTLTIDFTMYVTNPNDFKGEWTKLQDLAKITYPMYKGSGFHGQVVEVTIGKMYKGYKCIITDLGFDWDNETSWELDKKFHAPMSCNVSLSLTFLGDEDKGKKFEKDNTLYEFLK